MTTILAHVQDQPTIDQFLQNSYSLARSLGAHLECVQVTPFNAYLGAAGLGTPFSMGAAFETVEKRAKEFAEDIKARLAKEDVSWDFTSTTGDPTWELTRRAALADLVVTSREPDQMRIPPLPMTRMGELLVHSRTPIFVPGGDRPVDLTGRAVIAWDGSYEAANAARAAVPLLKLASDVRVVRVEEKEEEFPSTRLLEYLSRHGIKPELVVEPFEEEAIEPILVSHAHRNGPGYLIMGGYGHRRVTEFLFGGVTRTLLGECPVGLFIAR